MLKKMDLKTLLQSLLDHKVKYLVIGAWALPAYGIERMTRDFDIFIEQNETNVRKTIKALQQAGYLAVEDKQVNLFLTQKILLREYVLQTDIHPFVKGSEFSRAWRTRKMTNIKGYKVFVPSLDELLKMKRAANRPKDVDDILRLEKVKAKIQRKKSKVKI